MNKLIVIVIAFFITFSACIKNDAPECNTVTTTAPAAEVEALRTYLDTNSISATEDSRGFFYSISNPGTGTKPTICNAVQVNYTGKFTNGTVFETNTGAAFYLSGLIPGWQEGIPLIAPGGTITLYLPPSLAYGSSGSGSIPPNSTLIFDITLVSVF
jgi:FKBP-type peptidyl-prolyl cis-trans isomerase FkpA